MSPNIVAKVLADDGAKREVESILKEQKDKVVYLLEQNRGLVEALRDALLEHEELMGDEILHVLRAAQEGAAA